MRRDWGRILEITFWVVALVWLLYPMFVDETDAPFRMRFYYRLSKMCYGAAGFFGDAGLQAEQTYWEVVNELRG